MGVVAITYLRSRSVNLFAGLAVPFALIEFVGTLITRNPNFYLASAAINDILFGLLFLVSLLFSRPLILIFAEAMGTAPKEILRTQFRSAFQVLTAIWGIVILVKATVLIFSQVWLPLEVFLTIRALLGLPLFVVMMVFSFRFPNWYQKRVKAKISNEGS